MKVSKVYIRKSGAIHGRKRSTKISLIYYSPHMIELIMKIQASSRFKQAPTYLVIKVKFSNR